MTSLLVPKNIYYVPKPSSFPGGGEGKTAVAGLLLKRDYSGLSYSVSIKTESEARLEISNGILLLA